MATLKGGEGVKVNFNSKQIRTFFLGLKKLYELSREGLSPGETEFAVGKIDEIIQIPNNRKRFVSQLLSKDYGEEIWQELLKTNPDLATRLSMAKLHAERQSALFEFEKSLNKDMTESYWQSFFEKNQWIFGYGLKYYFMTHLSCQPSYGGVDFTGSGNQKGDFLLNTEAEIKFTVLVEIKKPTTKLIGRNKNGKPVRYRNGAWHLGQELYAGVSQVQMNCKTWQSSSNRPENYDKLSKEKIYTANPKGILVIGNTKEFENNREKIESFELFRKSINNPEIITFDELYERARFIVAQKEKS